MSETQSQVCSGGSTLIFACSGAADVGQVADLAARSLMRNGSGRMFCLAGIGAGIEPILNKTRQAQTILAIDGCGLRCAKLGLEKAGFTNFKYLQLADLGMEKGKTPLTEENVRKAAYAGNDLLGGSAK